MLEQEVLVSEVLAYQGSESVVILDDQDPCRHDLEMGYVNAQVIYFVTTSMS